MNLKSDEVISKLGKKQYYNNFIKISHLMDKGEIDTPTNEYFFQDLEN